MFSLGFSAPGQFGDILGNHPKSLSSGDHKWLPLASLSSGREMGLRDMLG